MFENIECEWPLFFCYLILNHAFQNNKDAVSAYAEKLEEIMVKTEEGMKLVPELYTVPSDSVSEEYKRPGSSQRQAVGRVSRDGPGDEQSQDFIHLQTPFLWAQSLYILGKLLQEGFLAVGELDPLNRRLGAQKKPDVRKSFLLL